jgi:glycosyltransferase involved in cell wall biosynthesis
MTQPISAFIISKDEADRIGPTLAALREVADEIVVVDSGSKDETVAIAQRAGARVFHQDWLGYGPQKRFAEDQCTHDWLLNLDADEVLSPELVDEIRALFQGSGPDRDAYEIVIAEVFPGERAPAAFAYSLAPVRLYDRRKGRYADSTVHDRVDLAPGATVARLRHRVHHFSIRSLRHEMTKLLTYADRIAAAKEHRHRRPGALRLVSEFPLAFLKAYVLRRHFLRGAYGWAIAINYAYYRHMRIVAMYEHWLTAPEPSPADRNDRHDSDA